MRINWKRFAFVFCLLQVMLFAWGCTAAWLSALSGMLPALEAAVTALISFVLALEGKTVPASVAAAIQKIGQDISTEIANVQALIAAYKSAASTGLLDQIQAVMQAVQANLSQILAGASVTDPSTVQKITQFVGLAAAAVQAILALLPLAILKMKSGAPKVELEAEDKMATTVVNHSTKALRETYAAIIKERTKNPDVNVALDSLPRSI